MVDDRGAVSRNDPFINAGNENLRLWSTGQFFDAFFPWDYVAEDVIPATNKALMAEKLPETNGGEFRVFLGTWCIISLHPGYSAQDFFIKNSTRV